jgi:hypothetical protein
VAPRVHRRRRVESLGKSLGKSGYGQYLLALLRDDVR